MRFIASFEKVALIGPLADLANLGIPSAAGYVAGRASGAAEAASGKKLDEPGAVGKAVKWLLIPGYTGWRYGRAHGHAAATKEKDKK